jgi:micrococcal nuclease
MPERSDAGQGNRDPVSQPLSGGQRRRRNWGRATLLAVAMLAAALLAACRTGNGNGGAVLQPASTAATARPSVTVTGSPGATFIATATVLPSLPALPSPTRVPSRTAIARPTRTPSPTATVTSTSTPTRVLVAADVVGIVDGDTIHVRMGGETYRVRYIGIDTPEIVHPGLPVEPFGPEAAEANRRLVEGQRVMLERDISDTDVYGRLLRYVWLGDLMVNGELVRLGLARANSYPPDVRHQAYLDGLEDAARAAGLGIWGPVPTVAAGPPEHSTRTGVAIVGVDKQGRPESVVLTNGSDGVVDLTGWWLLSVRGSQRYTLPAGTVLAPGASITIYSGPGADTAGGLFWTTEHVWNNSEPDPAELYDAGGSLVDRWPD